MPIEDGWAHRRANYRKELITDFFIESLQKGCIVFGAAALGEKIIKGLKKINIPVIAVVDNDVSKQGILLEGIAIRNPEILLRNDVPVVIASKFVKEIDDQLAGMSIKQRIPHYILSLLYPAVFPNELYRGAFEAIQNEWTSIETAYNLLADDASRTLFQKLIQFRHTLRPSDLPIPQKDQYFTDEFWERQENEVFVDVGAFDGDTFREYILRSGGAFHKYVAIEPDAKNYEKLVQCISEEYTDKVIAINAAAGISQARHVFLEMGGLDSRLTSEVCGGVVEEQRNVVATVALDDILAGYSAVHTIKIDVEGWEPYVLAGAERTIREKSPRLAVCVYHRPEHLWSLILQIAVYNPAYRFFLKHHETEIYGSVLYCIPGGGNG